jgi:PIN domain nuclease of toxin-antitoxin system
MRLLLDTHIWLWTLLAPERLGQSVRGALEDAQNELWLSPINVWEASLLCAKGRIALKEEIGPWLQKALAAASLHEAPLSHEIALDTLNLRLPHRDPADHFLASTARVLGLTLVTADERLIKAGQFDVLPNQP